jgi:hypothetical protein
MGGMRDVWYDMLVAPQSMIVDEEHQVASDPIKEKESEPKTAETQRIVCWVDSVYDAMTEIVM